MQFKLKDNASMRSGQDKLPMTSVVGLKIEGLCYQNVVVLDYQQKQKGLKANSTPVFFANRASVCLHVCCSRA